MSQRIAVTGVGAVTAFGDGVAPLVAGWTGAETAVTDGFGACTRFAPERVLTRSVMRRTDRYAQMALTAAEEAATTAGWVGGTPYEPHRVATVIATASAGALTVENELRMHQAKGEKAVAALRVMLAAPDAAAVLISMRFQAMGESYGMSGACAGGAMAIGHGVRLIRSGAADAVIVGGADAGRADLVVAMYRNLGAISRTSTCKPFDIDRDGFVPGEGAAVMILERYEDAARRGAGVLGEILGYGASSDAHHLTQPLVAGEVAAMTAALDDADVDARDITCVNAHGTGTALNDSMETSAVATALGSAAQSLPISSIKSAIGHLQGAAGAVEAVAALATLRERVVAPTVNLRNPDPDLAMHTLPTTALPVDDTRSPIAMSNSFGLGGHNATLIIRAA